MPGKATQDEILSLQQQVNEQSDKGELISEIEQVREESRVCTKEGNMSIEVMEEKLEYWKINDWSIRCDK